MTPHRLRPRLAPALAALAAVLAPVAPVLADDAPALERVPPVMDVSTITPDPAKGYEILLSVPMAGGVLTRDQLDRLWHVWEPEEKAKAEAASPEERRRMTFDRYGLTPRPEGDTTGLPLGMTDDGEGNLVTNCFSCHGGKVGGVSMPGVGNSHQDLTTLAHDTMKLQRLDAGGDPESVKMPPMPFGVVANFSKGYSNATQFAPLLGAMRDQNLDFIGIRHPGPIVNNDMVAPAWWHFAKKEKIYCDAFAPKTHRTLMQFTMSPTNTGADIRSWEPNFIHIQAYIESLQAPAYPFEIDRELAAEGKELFVQSCARCHGTYGSYGEPDGEYPNKIVPIDEIGTDRARFGAVSREGREHYNKMWFSDYGEHPVDLESVGYIAPPLDGVWASGPYFHNGAVPTLWHVLHPAKRPVVWKRTEDGYDKARVGLEIEEFDEAPATDNSRLARTYFDTRTPSHGAQGHDYPDELDDAEKLAVLEYLKTI